nr:H-NS family nucleoid-associated regulatory protein [Cupriavidus sp. USMAHM13]
MHSSPHYPSVPPFAAASLTEQLRRRADAILWVRTQMAKFSLTFDDLVAGGCFPGPAARAPKSAARYRSADGQSWDGEGALPDWLQRAVNAGQSMEHFRLG